MTENEANGLIPIVPDTRVYGILTRDVEMHEWNGHHPPDENMTRRIVPAGTRIRIWMVSRFGDVGVTDNLQDAYGYAARVRPEDITLEPR